MMQRARQFVFDHFERLLVVIVVASMVVIHAVIDYKVAFLSFYFLPVIIAGFYVGRTTAVWSSVLIVSLVAFFQVAVGLEGDPGLDAHMALTLIPWAGFLILTGHVVGTLVMQRDRAARDLRETYITMLELLTFYLESKDRHRGHSYRVAQRATDIASELGMGERELESLRVAALLHEIGAGDPKLQRLFTIHPQALERMPVADSLRSASEVLAEYSRYHELVGADWPVDQVRVSLATKVLAVADAFETLQLPNEIRSGFPPFAALEEIERGAGRTFGSEAVRALRTVASRPEQAERSSGRIKLVAQA